MDDFAEFVRTHEKRVYNACLRSCGSSEDAFDLSQEVFLKAWRSMDSFRGDADISTWLYRLTINVCTDFARKKARRRENMNVPLDETEPFLRDERYQPALVLDKMELARTLEAALSELSPEQRHIITLREHAGLTYKEIGETLGLEEGTVKSRLARARLALRERIIDIGNITPSNTSNRYKKGGGRNEHM